MPTNIWKLAKSISLQKHQENSIKLKKKLLESVFKIRYLGTFKLTFGTL